MEFTKEVLQKIAHMGLNGLSFSRLASELNTTPGELRQDRLINRELDDALRDFEFNAEVFLNGKMMEYFISQNKELFAETTVQIYQFLKDKNGM